jgi:hypothetical protein
MQSQLKKTALKAEPSGKSGLEAKYQQGFALVATGGGENLVRNRPLSGTADGPTEQS